MRDLLFILTALLTLGFAFYAAFSRNVIYSAFALLASLSGVAGLYVFLSGDFLAAVQVLVYVGGVMVLFLFALMVTRGIEIPAASNPGRRAALALLAIVPFLLASAFFISAFGEGDVGSSGVLAAHGGGGAVYAPITATVGRSLIERHMIAFEALSVLLLVALVGAVAIVRRTILTTEGKEKSDIELAIVPASSSSANSDPSGEMR